ncbi:MAG: peptidylprolyl isomerase [Alphaproteobacteria bacterium]|nr:peptidylprolyl isomerase [Alphaproteobacteria bacterium]
MRFKAIAALFTGILFAGSLAAQSFQSPPPPPPLTPENTWLLDLSTGGRVTIQLRPDIAPKSVERIKALTARGFYNGLTFHRVIDGFMAQGGDPKGDGTGGSDLPNVPAEFSGVPHMRGTVSMARADDVNSANSQFFIMLLPKLSLDTHYTAFGRVISGMNYVDAIEKGEPPANPSRIVHASLGSDNFPLPPPGALAPTPPVTRPAPPAGPMLPPGTTTPPK